ncbi:pyridoxine/pyridoxamine 5'-phosphate oxidase [Phytoactinopolyspora alkaliphila]|uniref:pyridoxine/pyridoxamine 5'-phosphate oxidase n=1 Tax=Phytoactinopolyspora alkaliphila TaxID=1783498 RepID=UPI001C20454F|nr:pyridoxal 5'-phosphate synthase [Phytoactinopolyspora alkaliphila]
MPVFPATLPTFEPDEVQAEPQELFLDWLDEAVEGGVPAPHVMTLSTVDDGRAAARVLILKDVTDQGWQFASRSDSPKGHQIAEHAHVALTFFWQQLGRQIRISGQAASLGEAAGARDFLARPEASRASGLVGRQSLPMHSMDEYREAYAAARERIAADPGIVAPTWTVYMVRPDTVEFWQASHERAHIRLRYERGTSGWRTERLWP